MGQACNLSTQEAEAGGAWAAGQPMLHRETGLKTKWDKNLGRWYQPKAFSRWETRDRVASREWNTRCKKNQDRDRELEFGIRQIPSELKGTKGSLSQANSWRWLSLVQHGGGVSSQRSSLKRGWMTNQGSLELSTVTPGEMGQEWFTPQTK